ncbi:hypothetical protein CBR_g17922 [Chara braunii]|uniref:Uncharacterized protein n=1 Tax=Chara braunii TaxID=69332 RepID=A0A388KVW8_CHABU|nr:hypothetical protein CBR_g17922 [Chara braunii]|eukprot:GBG74209.1 hypothetical protein CBR_g17922 [Chara braunii]
MVLFAFALVTIGVVLVHRSMARVMPATHSTLGASRSSSQSNEDHQPQVIQHAATFSSNGDDDGSLFVQTEPDDGSLLPTEPDSRSGSLVQTEADVVKTEADGRGGSLVRTEADGRGGSLVQSESYRGSLVQTEPGGGGSLVRTDPDGSGSLVQMEPNGGSLVKTAADRTGSLLRPESVAGSLVKTQFDVGSLVKTEPDGGGGVLVQAETNGISILQTQPDGLGSLAQTERGATSSWPLSSEEASSYSGHGSDLQWLQEHVAFENARAVKQLEHGSEGGSGRGSGRGSGSRMPDPPLNLAKPSGRYDNYPPESADEKLQGLPVAIFSQMSLESSGSVQSSDTSQRQGEGPEEETMMQQQHTVHLPALDPSPTSTSGGAATLGMKHPSESISESSQSSDNSEFSEPSDDSRQRGGNSPVKLPSDDRSRRVAMAARSHRTSMPNLRPQGSQSSTALPVFPWEIEGETAGRAMHHGNDAGSSWPNLSSQGSKASPLSLDLLREIDSEILRRTILRGNAAESLPGIRETTRSHERSFLSSEGEGAVIMARGGGKKRPPIATTTTGRLSNTVDFSVNASDVDKTDLLRKSIDGKVAELLKASVKFVKKQWFLKSNVDSINSHHGAPGAGTGPSTDSAVAQRSTTMTVRPEHASDGGNSGEARQHASDGGPDQASRHASDDGPDQMSGHASDDGPDQELGDPRPSGYLDGRSHQSSRPRFTCDLTEGVWVKERESSRSYSVYHPDKCPFVSPSQNCRALGRRDREYEMWRFEPKSCDPDLSMQLRTGYSRDNSNSLVESLAGKRLAVVGDSILRNLFESLACLLHHRQGLPETIISRSKVKKYVWPEHNLTIAFYRTPFLIEDRQAAVSDTEEDRWKKVIVELKSVSSTWRSDVSSYDVLVINSGHWWNSYKLDMKGVSVTLNGKEMLDVDVYEAFSIAMEHVMLWLADTERNGGFAGDVIVPLSSPQHFQKGDWNTGGVCPNVWPLNEEELKEHRERRSWIDDKFNAALIAAARSANELAFRRGRNAVGNKFRVLPLTRLSEARADAHPASYVHPQGKVSDCSHWCLPGVPDVWNAVLQLMLTDAGKFVGMVDNNRDYYPDDSLYATRH